MIVSREVATVEGVLKMVVGFDQRPSGDCQEVRKFTMRLSSEPFGDVRCSRPCGRSDVVAKIAIPFGGHHVSKCNDLTFQFVRQLPANEFPKSMRTHADRSAQIVPHPRAPHPHPAPAPRTPHPHPAPRTSHQYRYGIIVAVVHRFFAPFDPGDDIVALPREEAEHLTRVLRLGVGDSVSVFDGRGHEFLARVASAVRQEVRLQLVSRIDPPPEPNVAITLAQAVLKGDKMDDVVRDAVMLGAVAIQPVVSTRSETTVAALLKGARIERWRRVAVASVKQSRRAVLPEIRVPLSIETLLNDPATALRLMLVEPGAADAVEPLAAIQRLPLPADVTILVGPEGGWTAAECNAARDHGVRLITLGHRTLRADAVPVAAISVLQFLWGDL